MVNNRKGKELKHFWCNPGEYEELIIMLEGNYKEEVLDIIFKIYHRGDLEQ